MLNDATCFKNVYIVTGYTDLRSGIDRLASLVKSKMSDPHFSQTPSTYSVEEERIASKDWSGNLMDIFFYISAWNRVIFNGHVQKVKCVHLHHNSFVG